MTAEKQNKKITNKKVILIALLIFLLEQLFQLVVQLMPQTGLQSIIIQLCYLVFAFFTAYYINNFDKKIDKQAGIDEEPSWWQSIGRGIWIIPLTYMINVIFQSGILIFVKHYPKSISSSINQQAIQQSFDTKHLLFLLTSAVTIVIIAPWCEEFLFRVALINQPSFSNNKTWIYVIRIICSTLLFAYMHMSVQSSQLFGNGPHHVLALIQFCSYLSISCVLTYMYVRYKSYRTDVAAHMIWNCLTLITML